MGKYKRFKENNIIPSGAILIPPCIYLSPQEMALNEDRQWHTFNPDQQVSYVFAFNNYLSKHKDVLVGIAG